MSNIQSGNLTKGKITIHQLGDLTVYAYLTNDAMNDTVFIFEKGSQAVVLEQPNFFENIEELETYLNDQNINVVGVIPAYHMAGAFLPSVKHFSTKDAYAFATGGRGQQMVDGFAAAFGGTFDTSVPAITDFIEGNQLSLAGINFKITKTNDAFDVEIPEAHLVYIHMLGHDTHSIIASIGHAEATINQLRGFIRDGYQLILSSHHAPETLKDVETKVAYLEQLVEFARKAKTADEFKTSMKTAFPDMAGENYLDMTAASLYT